MGYTRFIFTKFVGLEADESLTKVDQKLLTFAFYVLLVGQSKVPPTGDVTSRFLIQKVPNSKGGGVGSGVYITPDYQFHACQSLAF